MTRLPILQNADSPELPSGALPTNGRRRALHPADVHGRFHSARRVVLAVLIAFWAALPWLKVRGNPALFIDVDGRRLFLFGLTFNAQDTWLLFFLLTGVGFGLFYATMLAGRVWCGWACPQTVFLEGVFRPIQRWIEGPREQRIRGDAGPWTFHKVARKVALHGLYLIVALAVAHIFLSYFVSLPKAIQMVRGRPAAHPEAFVWVVAMTSVFYFNFSWFREQLCVVICPYGRLQSAMLDAHSLVVGYDSLRGEPRGKKGTEGAGDCVDCKRCVVVCPTGIDIRNGVQMECIGCTACIDACDEIMDKLGRERGLVRYDSLDGLSGKRRRFLRGRMIFYTFLMVVGGIVAFVSTRKRTDFEVTLSRLPGEPYSLETGLVRNALELHLVNKRATAQTYRVDVDPFETMTAVVPLPRVSIGPLGDARVPVFLSMPRDRFSHDVPVEMRVARADDPGGESRVHATFLGPSR